jgi:hypothetical protein
VTTDRLQIQEQIDRLLAHVERMTDAELLLLRSVWNEQVADIREGAWGAVKAVLRRRRGRQALLEQARARVAAWVNNYPTATLDTYGYFLVSGSGLDPSSVRKAAIPPIVDALAATIAADGLTTDQQTVLLKPMLAIAPHAGRR